MMPLNPLELTHTWKNLRPFFKVLLVVLFALWSYVLLRAILLSYTHDEAITFSIISGNTEWIKTANNHFLNTLFSGISALFLGNAEWALRLPNVLAFGIYAYYGFRLLQPLPALYAALGASAIFLNPFILDFFGLSRGYGLALSLQMAGIYYITQYAKTAQIKHFYSVAIAGGLMLYANFSFLVPYFALMATAMGAYAWHQYKKLSGNMAQQGDLAAQWQYFIKACDKKDVLKITIASILWSIPAIAFSFLLKAKGELYFGGTQGFFAETVQSLLLTTAYRPHNSLNIFNNWGIAIGVFYLFICLFLLRYCLYWFRNYFGVLFLLLNICVLSVLGLYYGLGVLLPIERAAIYFIPLTGLALAYGAYTIMQAPTHRAIKLPVYLLSVELILLLVVNFAVSANIAYTLTWQYDADTRNALNTLQKNYHAQYEQTKQPAKVSVTWYLEPVVNYYRITRKMDWLAPVTRHEIESDSCDYYYCFPADASFLSTCNKEIALLQQFQRTHNLLLTASR
jgi:hypothetical protein